MRTRYFLLWSWGTMLAMGAFIFWLATIPYVTSTSAGDEVIKVLFRMVLYSVFFLLTYRAILATLRNTVGRLAGWHSKREAQEDMEFVLIIETLIVIVTLLFTVLFSAFEQYLKSFVPGRNAELKDVLVTIMASLLTALVVYTMPVIGELEVALKQKFLREFRSKSTKSKRK